MSLLPDGKLEDGRSTKSQRVPGWKQPWDRGRILMIAGCVMLLLLSIAQGITKFGLPRWFDIVVRVSGYLLLVAGFALRMKMKREHKAAARERAEAAKGTSPRAPG